jgi:hypothetical protein
MSYDADNIQKEVSEIDLLKSIDFKLAMLLEILKEISGIELTKGDIDG